jgi:hypothetical protein
MNPRVKAVRYKSPHTLIVTFINDEIKEFNLAKYLSYPVFEKLNDESFCSKAKALYGTVVWDDETDFDPDTLYLEGVAVDSQPVDQ